MRRILSTLALCSIFALNVLGQVKYCLSYADFKEGNWLELESLTVKERSRAKKFWTGGSDFKLQAENDSLNRIITKDAFAISYNDTLLVNCRRLYFEDYCFGKGYASAYIYGKGKVCFVAHNPASAAVGGASVGMVVGPVAGGIISGTITATDAYCFLVKLEQRDGKVTSQMIDDDFMERFEESSPDFYAEYMSEKKKRKRESAAHVLPLLKEWQLIQ